MKEQIMTIQEVADNTGLQVSYIYQLTSKRKIPHYKPGNGKLIFKRSEIQEFIFSNKIKTQEELEQDAANFKLKKK
ncbi:helix-turn-helix transcriptional regulator [Chryseobacterium chendengshani]|uniref:helix-turn-helix transcriptional regulator n=1 Tax=Chryseobacterium sp. LJ756 TaxID=2864113 RepID=UPI001C64200C|nr:excisionase family DNA-binding protein [Chryseobacterium sp. LJ756]MBW7675669.1 excisionase family DNA-binding protein [Chryseobacterium sp. LJ756]